MKTGFSMPGVVLAACAFGALPSVVAADESGDGNGITLDLGTFMLNTHTSVRVDGDTQRGSDVDLEDDLGFGDVSRFRLDGAWRFADRHSVRAMYFDNSRSRTNSIDRTLDIRDTEFPIGADVASEFRTRIADITYEYAFLQKPGYELAASFGVHSVSFDFGMEADVTVPGSTSSVHLDESVDTGSPLPLVGVRGQWQLSERWSLEARAQYFYLSIDEYDGSISDVYAGATWMFSKHVGLGVGYNQFRFKVDVDQRLFNGALSWRYGGAMAFLRAAF